MTKLLQRFKKQQSFIFSQSLSEDMEKIDSKRIMSLSDLKSMQEKQEKEKADLISRIKNGKQESFRILPGASDIITNWNKKQDTILLNLNLESVVKHCEQEKLKRDRIGIIFSSAIQEFWDETPDGQKLSDEQKV